MFDTPKKTKILNIISTRASLKYLVQYKYREFEVRNEDVYPNKIDAEIHWAIFVMQEYDKTLEINDFFITDEFEIANFKALKLLNKYSLDSPDILLKYL